MPDRTARTPAPSADRPDLLRNVALVGAGGTGKTTLAEALAHTAGVLTRAGTVPDGTTTADWEEIEHRQQRSVQLALLPLPWRGHKVNLLDAPGYADFAGELQAALRAAEAALFVHSAADPELPRPVLELWRRCERTRLPRAVVLTHLNTARVRLDDVLRMLQDTLGTPDTVRPLHHVDLRDGRLHGLTDLLTGRTYGAPGDTPDPAAERARLVEALAGEDDTLLARYLDGEPLDLPALTAGLRREVLAGTLHPVLATAPTAPDRTGCDALLDLLADAFPSPADRTDDLPPADPDAPLTAQVVHTGEDPYLGRLSLLKVFAGTLRPDTAARLPDGTEEHLTAPHSPLGHQLRPVPHAVAGDLATVTKLTSARTGDTLTGADAPDAAALPPWPLPEALLPTAVRARSEADDDKLSQALGRLSAQDPALRVEQNPDTGQLVLWCTGEAHLAVTLDRLTARHGVRVDTVDYQVALRETFAAPAEGHGRHVKQSGGHGQYAICDLTVEPLPGGGFEFVDRVVGGTVPRHFVPSVEKGVRAQLARGLRGHPMTDVRVTLTDGRAHAVDSSDAAFQTAAALALKEAAEHGSVEVLEPVDEVRVLLPDEYQGAVLGDLSARRGHVLGTEVGGEGLSLVRAEVPELELARYPLDLRSLSHGTGRFTRRYLRHAPMPAHLAARHPDG